ncbi:MAG: class I tRNA ligase family protein [Ruminococcus sp.]|nr:class I tRNA ligase family protein [Ruminococcus sp.]
MGKDNSKANEYAEKKYNERPQFPKRAVITGGMPYGNKQLHFGHIGGVFVFADVFARFLRDRIGKDNVIFVSGTDCYGSPIAESYRKLCENEGFTGSIQDFVRSNHEAQKHTLDDYNISLNLFGASGLDRTSEVHHEVTDKLIRQLYNDGHLKKITTKQFFDEKAGVFLNGRQVIGKCPIENCQSEKGYADECDLGHQYMPEQLLEPKSTLTGEKPIMKDVVNWYFDLPKYNNLLKEYTSRIKRQKNVRPLVSKTIDEFLKKPEIYIKKEFKEVYESVKDQLAPHELISEGKKPSFTIVFDRLEDSDKATEILSANGVRYRTGKTLVPFRLTGNIEWGVPAPSLEGEENLTVWVWPESLWAPISFTIAYLESIGKDTNEWKDYWCSKDSQVYQFIGQDNIYFYGVAEMGLFMALQGKDGITSDPKDGDLQLPILMANNHILFLDKKASSSSNIKPPMASELLNYYTAEQLRMHYLGLGLGQKSVSFQPKPLNPNANPKDSDPVVKDGFLLSNVFNRIIRTCIYKVQECYDGYMPLGEVSEDILEMSRKAILDFERFMYRFEFHQTTYVLDTYIRKSSKYMVKNLNDADKQNDDQLRKQILINMFHIIKTASILLHSMTPNGTEKVLEYLNLSEDANKKFWCWDYIFDTLQTLCPNEDTHKLKFLPPRTDFFTRHPSQFENNDTE